MGKLTPKENYLRLGRGEMPGYIPFYTMMGNEYLGEACVKTLNPTVFSMGQFVDGGYDMWGVRYKADPLTGATLPEPNNFMLHDINDWEKVLVFPDRHDDYDFERMYEEGIREAGIDRTQSALMSGPGLMPFQQLIAFMGFNEGLMATFTDPDVVSDMLNAMVDWIEPVMYKTVEYFKPDLWYILDDTCAKLTPFISLDTYEELFLPIYRRLAKPATDRGIPIQFHNCGKCEIFIQDMIDFGVRYWDPAQECNDLLMIKEKYKGQICLCGGWDWGHHMPRIWPEYDEEELRQSVRDSIDKYGKDGGYAFAGGILGMNENARKANQIIRDECHFYGRKVMGCEI